MISTIVFSSNTQSGLLVTFTCFLPQAFITHKNTTKMKVRFITFANIMIAENISRIQQEIGQSAQLVIVSKFRTITEIHEAYDTGHRQFAENRVQALLERAEQLPQDI